MLLWFIQALLEDRLLVNVVQGSDPIPRFSLLTLHHLAEEIKVRSLCDIMYRIVACNCCMVVASVRQEFSAQASEWAAEDTMDLQVSLQWHTEHVLSMLFVGIVCRMRLYTVSVFMISI